MPGRPSIPIEIARLKGRVTADKQRKADAALQKPDSPIGEAPEWFTPRMLAEWNRITKDPEVSLTLAADCRPTLIHHCVLTERLEQDARGERLMTASERQTYNSIQMQLGATPAARSKVPRAEKKKADDPWAKFG